MFEREDLMGVHISATLKQVGAGEVRTRLRLGAALLTITKAVHLTKASALAWQGQFHRHHLQQERYLVLVGTIGYVSMDGDRLSSGILEAGESVTFQSRIWHDILTTPGAEFVTLQMADIGIDVEADREVIGVVPNKVVHETRRLLYVLGEP